MTDNGQDAVVSLVWRYEPPILPPVARQVSKATPLAAGEPAQDLVLALDPARLSSRIGLTPDDWQARLLRSEAHQLLINCSRQVGKSTTTALLAVHTALYAAPGPILLLSPSLRQSLQLFGKVKWALKRLGSTFAPLVTDNALSVRLANGNEIHALPGSADTVRGFSGVRLVVVDEAAFVGDDLYPAVSPMLAVSGGRLVLLSTPFGKRGFFYQQWDQGGAAWERIEVRAEACPRIPAAFLAEERRKLGALYDQEYGCQFLDIVRSVFSGEDIRAALAPTLAPLTSLLEVA